MRTDTRNQIIASLALVLCLGASAVLSAQLSASAGRSRLGYADRAEEGDPPEVSLGIAMGAFRGIFVNWLWIRANQMKEDGRYYEAIELAKAITRLQPRFPHVWAFHAWNMAYNISVTTHTLRERLQWVQAGIRLLRDEGIPANPNDLLLHKELAYIFLHKVQGYTDDANQYYKRMHAVEWQILLGPAPRPDPRARDRDAAVRRYVDWIAPVATSPPTLEGVFAEVPAARDLVDALASVELAPGRQLLEAYEAQRAVRESGQSAFLLSSMRERNRRLADLVADPRYARAWPALLAHVRQRIIVDDYHMEPDRMIRYTREFGPIDWRHPGAHGLYWAARGVENAIRRVENRNRLDYDFVNTDRLVIQAIQELWRSGEVYMDFLGYVMNPDNPNFFYLTMPNVHFVDSYGRTLATLRDRSEFDKDTRAYTVYAAGYENFLVEAIRFYFRRGQLAEAEKRYQEARLYPHHNQNDPDREVRFSKPLAQFVWDESADEYTRPDIARAEVIGALQGAYVSGLLAGDTELFRRQFEFAKQAHRFFMERQRRISAMNPEGSRMDVLPSDFRLAAAGIFAQLLAIMDPDDAEVIYDNAPDDVKRYGYDMLQRRFRQEFEELARRGGRGFSEVFPEPPGMDAFRAEMARLEAEASRRPQTEMK